MLKVITMAALLSWASFAQLTANSNVQFSSNSSIEAALLLTGEGISQDTEKVLIEDHAAPNWGFTIEEAWFNYYQGELVIIEIEKDRFYELQYNGGYIQVLMEEH